MRTKVYHSSLAVILKAFLFSSSLSSCEPGEEQNWHWPRQWATVRSCVNIGAVPRVEKFASHFLAEQLSNSARKYVIKSGIK